MSRALGASATLHCRCVISDDRSRSRVVCICAEQTAVVSDEAYGWHTHVMDEQRDVIEQRVITAATSTGVAIEVLDCDPDLADTAAFCAAYGIAVADSANTIMVATKENPPRYVACVVLATHRLDVNGVVRRRLGARKVSFARADATAALTGMVMGGVTPFGLPDDIEVWVDAAVMERDEIITGGGSRAIKLRHAPAALQALITVQVVELLAQPLPPDADA